MGGRRIVEISSLIEGLKACCKCGERLSLVNIVKETRWGLGSIFYVECGSCNETNTVLSGKRHAAQDMAGDASEGRRSIFDINTKLAAGTCNNACALVIQVDTKITICIQKVPVGLVYNTFYWSSS